MIDPRVSCSCLMAARRAPGREWPDPTTKIVAAAAFACVQWKRLPESLRLAAWIALAWVAAHVVFWAQPRFRYPMDVPLALP